MGPIGATAASRSSNTIANNSDGTLYFAYGSNLSTSQMRDRCPQSTPVALARLPGWKWIINTRGVANIVRDTDPPRSPTKWPILAWNPLPLLPLISRSPRRREDDDENDDEKGVFGVLYRLHPQDEAALDDCEGVPYIYERQFLEVMRLPAPGAAKTHIQMQHSTVKVLVYVDTDDTETGPPRSEYVGRMNRAVDEAVAEWGLPRAYADGVIRPRISA
ncbi:hypothetical protein GGR53DRAFT_143210 [Hypoxylon sp. FL1150]|nr:hypothetical protein GGR53DRAFT_143210 [Hypoxylon sp. FL1150]